jgi:hypothetical protein
MEHQDYSAGTGTLLHYGFPADGDMALKHVANYVLYYFLVILCVLW